MRQKKPKREESIPHARTLQRQQTKHHRTVPE